MDISRSRYFKQTVFPPGAFQETIGHICDSLQLPHTLRVNARYDHGDGVNEEKELDYEQLGTLRSFGSGLESIRFHLGPINEHVYVMVSAFPTNIITLFVSANSVLKCNSIGNIFRDTLKLCEVNDLFPEVKEQHDTPKEHPKPIAVLPKAETPPPRNNELELPEKITAAWLLKHTPIQFWFWLFGAFTAVFLAGIKIGLLDSFRNLLK